ncbi:MAG: hypothetical protein WC289_02600 [Patescibacteria group bacterium]|jgi:hypothetical protein
MTNQNKLSELQQMVETAIASLSAARQIFRDLGLNTETDPSVYEKAKKVGAATVEGDEKVIEGIFDGQHMVGPDGKRYSVPANYASKSKLVEGDMLKLTITSDGSFVYKQIGPIERSRLVGTLTSDETTGEHRVLAGGKSYKVLLASVTYFKGEPGDEVVILVPKEAQAVWAAVENIIKEGDPKPETIDPVVTAEQVAEANTAAEASAQDDIDDIE